MQSAFYDRFTDTNGDGIDDVTSMPYVQGFGWVDENGDGINDYYGYHYDGRGYRMSQNFTVGMGMQNPTWPMGSVVE